MSMRRFLLTLILLAVACPWYGNAAVQDSVYQSDPARDSTDTSTMTAADTVRTTWIKRYWHSLIHGNVDRTFEKKMDLSFAIAPSYTREGSVGIGGAATALYRLDRTDSLMQPSDISLTGNVSIKGFYSLAVKGNNNFKGNRSSLSYRLAFMHKNLDLWGISWRGCSSNPVSAYTRQQLRLETDYRYRLLPGFYAGATLNLNYTRALNMTAPEYLEGQNSSYYFTGVGLSLQYDTRDLIVNPGKGLYFLLRGVVYPEFLSTYDRTVLSATVILDAYIPAWEGCTVAFDLYGQLNSRHTPWTLREELGNGGSRMRGYYAGRFIDCNQIAAQVELRQHIWWRLGFAAWAGAGTVFPSFSAFSTSAILPNYGLGLRFEFKHRMNIRIDYGFGKGTSGLVVQFAEAF